MKFILLLTSAALGCSPTSAATHEASPAKSVSEPAQAERGARRPPLRASIEGPADVKPGTNIALRIVFERTIPNVPLRYEIVLPEGASVVLGTLSERIDEPAPRVERRILVHVERVPSADIVLQADLSDRSFGARALKRYAFGRPAQALDEPRREASPTLLNHQNLGHSVHLSPERNSMRDH